MRGRDIARSAAMKYLYSALFIAVLTMGTVAFAQDQSQSAPPQQKQQSADPPKVSITGCLTKGTSDGAYVIADQTSGDKVPFSGPSQLDRFVNQTVKLTGTMSGEGADKTFKPEAIAQVSPTCGKAQ
jgi:hypothetical protein